MNDVARRAGIGCMLRAPSRFKLVVPGAKEWRLADHVQTSDVDRNAYARILIDIGAALHAIHAIEGDKARNQPKDCQSQLGLIKRFRQRLSLQDQGQAQKQHRQARQLAGSGLNHNQ